MGGYFAKSPFAASEDVRGRLRASSATTGLLAMIHEAANTIPVLREAGVVDLMGAVSAAELQQLSSHASKAVRIAAVVALRRLGAAKELMSFLNDSSPQVMSDAVLAIYDAADAKTFGKHPQTFAAIAPKLAPSSPAPINMRALAANRRLATRGVVSRITAFLTALNHERQTERIMAMDMLASWSAQTTLDPVDGRDFPVPAFSADEIEAELAPHIMALAGDRHTEIAERAIALSARMKVSEEDITRAATAILADSTAIPLRFTWFRWLQKQRPERADAVAATAFTGTKPGLRMTAANHPLDRKLKANEVREYVMRMLNSSQDTLQLQGALELLKRIPESEAVLRALVESLRPRRRRCGAR